jgi:tryptophanyl-tRNA synthetase
VKIMSLDGNGKMSKSENQMATIFLADDDEAIRKKIMKAKTDSGPTEPNTPKPPYIDNLFTLMSIVSEVEVRQQFSRDYEQCVIRYGDMKKQLAEDMVKFIRPIRERAAEIQANHGMLDKIIKQGAAKARASASATLSEVRKAMVMNY